MSNMIAQSPKQPGRGGEPDKRLTPTEVDVDAFFQKALGDQPTRTCTTGMGRTSDAQITYHKVNESQFTLIRFYYHSSIRESFTYDTATREIISSYAEKVVDGRAEKLPDPKPSRFQEIIRELSSLKCNDSSRPKPFIKK